MTALLLTEVKVGNGDECCVMVAAGAAERLVRVTDRERERESECVAAGQPELATSCGLLHEHGLTGFRRTRSQPGSR